MIALFLSLSLSRLAEGSFPLPLSVYLSFFQHPCFQNSLTGYALNPSQGPTATPRDCMVSLSINITLRLIFYLKINRALAAKANIYPAIHAMQINGAPTL